MLKIPDQLIQTIELVDRVQRETYMVSKLNLAKLAAQISNIPVIGGPLLMPKYVQFQRHYCNLDVLVFTP